MIELWKLAEEYHCMDEVLLRKKPEEIAALCNLTIDKVNEILK